MYLFFHFLFDWGKTSQPTFMDLIQFTIQKTLSIYRVIKKDGRDLKPL